MAPSNNWNNPQVVRVKFPADTMKYLFKDYPKSFPKIVMHLAALGMIVLSGCGSKEPDGVFLIVELENSRNVKQYSVFNPYVHSLEKCQSSANTAIAQIFASDPPVIPRDSKVTSWRCSFTPPERGG